MDLKLYVGDDLNDPIHRYQSLQLVGRLSLVVNGNAD